MTALAFVCLALALLPLGLALANLRIFRAPPSPGGPPGDVSILIPARNEAATIEAAIAAALETRGVGFEVVVLDDHSEDRTAAIVQRMAQHDARLRLERAPPLPPGWNGKQHACLTLAEVARHPILAFVDADVRLAPDAVARAAGFLGERGLVSGFPREMTGTWLEHLIVPLIHVLLLGYLPMAMMRRSALEAFGAGCGQFMVARREAYEAVGGHGAVRNSRHDGITLPRAFRRQGFMTDIFDATELAECRMYEGAAATWNGFLKNATEGMATPVALPIWTLFLAGGHVLPWLLFPVAIVGGWSEVPVIASGLALAANLVFRLILTNRFEQHWMGIVLHPLSMLLLLVMQWQALIRAGRGRETVWRGRRYAG